MNSKQYSRKAKQAVSRGIANEWRLIMQMPLYKRVKVAWRIVKGR